MDGLLALATKRITPWQQLLYILWKFLEKVGDVDQEFGFEPKGLCEPPAKLIYLVNLVFFGSSLYYRMDSNTHCFII